MPLDHRYPTLSLRVARQRMSVQISLRNIRVILPLLLLALSMLDLQMVIDYPPVIRRGKRKWQCTLEPCSTGNRLSIFGGRRHPSTCILSSGINNECTRPLHGEFLFIARTIKEHVRGVNRMREMLAQTRRIEESREKEERRRRPPTTRSTWILSNTIRVRVQDEASSRTREASAL